MSHRHNWSLWSSWGQGARSVHSVGFGWPRFLRRYSWNWRLLQVYLFLLSLWSFFKSIISRKKNRDIIKWNSLALTSRHLKKKYSTVGRLYTKKNLSISVLNNSLFDVFATNQLFNLPGCSACSSSNKTCVQHLNGNTIFYFSNLLISDCKVPERWEITHHMVQLPMSTTYITF